MRYSDDSGTLAGPPPEREQDVLRHVLQLLSDRLPPSWSLHTEYEPSLGSRRPDALATIAAPDGSSARILIEVKRLLPQRDVTFLLEQLQAYRREMAPDATPFAAARYLSPSTRTRLAELGVAYGDATGNIRLQVERPALFIHTSGLDRDPWRGPGRPRGSLKGTPAARVVRTLTDFHPPYTVPQIVELGGVSTGAAYRVIDFLEEEALLQRAPRGPVFDVAWRPLIERWSKDHGLTMQPGMVPCLLPRGIESLETALRFSSLRYVLSGSIAAHHFAPYAPARLGMLYVTDIRDAMRALDLRPADRGANVLVVEAVNDVAYDRSILEEGVWIAAPAQIAVDLLSGPGRSPAEAHALMDWMETNEARWRREPFGPSPYGAVGRS